MSLNKSKLMYIPKSEKWFKDRIGQRIYRDSRRDCCPTCAGIVEDGLIVQDEFHARYLSNIDMDFGAEGVFFNYRDEK